LAGRAPALTDAALVGDPQPPSGNVWWPDCPRKTRAAVADGNTHA